MEIRKAEIRKAEIRKVVIRKVAAVLVGGLVLALSTMAAAWACTASASIATDVKSAEPGADVMVYGDVFNDAPVEIRWNSTDGPVLARGKGPGFTLGIRIPDTAAGAYTIVAVQHDETGAVDRRASAAFEVTEAPQPASSAPASEAPAAEAPTEAPAASAPAATPRASRPQRPPVAQAAPEAQSAPDAVAAPTAEAQSAPEAGPIEAPELTEAPAPLSARDDVWAGFQAGGSGPSLTEPGPGEALGDGGLLGVVLALAGAGIVMAGVGLAGATTRRRKATAGRA